MPSKVDEFPGFSRKMKADMGCVAVCQEIYINCLTSPGSNGALILQIESFAPGHWPERLALRMRMK
jgi:hypothetical protein